MTTVFIQVTIFHVSDSHDICGQPHQGRGQGSVDEGVRWNAGIRPRAVDQTQAGRANGDK